MSADQLQRCCNVVAFCFLVAMAVLVIMFGAIFGYWLARNLLAEVAGKPYPKLTREDVADWRDNNESGLYDILDGI